MARPRDIPPDDLPPSQRALARRAPTRSGEIESYTPPSDDDDAPQPEDLERFGGVTITCPECKSELMDDVAVCWKCGRAMDAPGDERTLPLWAIITALVAGAGLILLFVW